MTGEARPLTRSAWDQRLTDLTLEREHAVDWLEAIDAEIERTLAAPYVPDQRRSPDAVVKQQT